MQVYEINVRYMRRIQVREYEPAEAEVTVKAQLADGEKPEAAVSEAIKLASEQVHVSLGLAPDTKLPKRGKAGGQTETASTVTAQPKTETAKTAAAETPKPQPQQPASAVSDIPGEGVPATPQKAAASASDIPDDATVKPQPQQQQQAQASNGEAPPVNAAELSKWIGDQVRLGKVTSQAVMGLYPKFGVSRFADLKPEKCGEAKIEIEKLIGATAL